MGILDTTALSAALKPQYTQKKVQQLVYPDHPFFALLTKRRDFYGANKVVVFKYGNPQGRGLGSGGFTAGLANMSASKYKSVTVTRVSDFAFAEISGEAIEASQNDAGALLRALKSEVDGAFYTATRSLCIQLFRNGGGARGQISAGSNVGTATITLQTPDDVVNFEVGMVLNTSATDGTSGAKRAGTVTLTAIDRDAGTLTASGNWTAGIAAAAASDYIFQNGDFEVTKPAMAGLSAWIPAVAPTGGDNFFGLDRSVDPVRLAGLRYTAGAGGPIESTLVQCAARLGKEGSRPDLAILHPLDYANLVDSLGTKVVYDRVTSIDSPDIGFETVKLMAPKGPVKVLADVDCPRGGGWMLQSNVWAFESLMDAPRILKEDGLEILRSPTGDSYQSRIGYRGNLTCEAPGWNAYFAI